VHEQFSAIDRPLPPLCGLCGKEPAIVPSEDPFSCGLCSRSARYHQLNAARHAARQAAQVAQAFAAVYPEGAPPPAPRPPPVEPPAAPGCPPRCSLKKWTREKLIGKFVEFMEKPGFGSRFVDFCAELENQPSPNTVRGHFGHVGLRWEDLPRLAKLRVT